MLKYTQIKEIYLHVLNKIFLCGCYLSYIFVMVLFYLYSDKMLLLAIPVIFYVHYSHVLGLCLSRCFRYISILNHLCLIILYSYFLYKFYLDNEYVSVWPLLVPLFMYISLVWLMVSYFLQYRQLGMIDRDTMVKSMAVKGLEIFCEKSDEDSIGIVENAYVCTAEVMEECWGLDYKDIVPFYISRQCPEIKGVFDGVRWCNCVKLFYQFLFVTPFRIIFFLRMLIQSSAMVLQSRDNRPLVWVKPWDEIESGQVLFTASFFNGDFSKRERNIEYITCHEIAHVFFDHLKLPRWLNEGLAMIMVDRYYKIDVVKEQSIGLLRVLYERSASKIRKNEARNYFSNFHIPWYWVTRFIVEEYPELIEDFMKNKQSSIEIEKKIADILGIKRKIFWKEISQLVHWHYSRKFMIEIECA